MTALARIEDIEQRLGRRFADGEWPRPAGVLDDASALVRAEGNSAWTLDTVPEAVHAVVCRVAIRAIEHPEGFSSESGGDYSYQRKGAEDGVYLTDREARIVRRGSGRTGLWTQPVTRNEYVDRTEWVNTLPGSEPFPIGVRDPWW